MELKEITEKMEKAADEITTFREEAAKEIKKYGEMTEETSKNLKSLEEKLEAMNVKVEKSTIPTGERKEYKSAGEQFVESKAYKDMIASGLPTSSPFEVKDIVASRLIDTTGGLAIAPEWDSEIVQEPRINLTVADLVSQGTTSSNSIYFQKGTYTPAATPKKESKTGVLITKPASKFTFTPATETVKTIPVYIQVSRQILEDAPALASEINDALRYDVQLAKEEQILFGNGVDPQLNGICPQAQTYDSTLPTQLGVTTPTRIDHLRAAILQARQARYPVTGIVMNPFDWAAIELSKDSSLRYIWTSVNDGGVTRMWRTPVIDSDNMPEGYFLTGAFKLGAKLWNRSGPIIRISDSHATTFTENVVTILCELRSALVVKRPQAFVYGSFEEYGS